MSDLDNGPPNEGLPRGSRGDAIEEGGVNG